jgi:hypothetical protein
MESKMAKKEALDLKAAVVRCLAKDYRSSTNLMDAD